MLNGAISSGERPVVNPEEVLVDLSFLQPLYAVPGPFAAAYLDTSWDSEDAGHAIALRWRAQREALAEQGAGEPTLKAMDDVVGTERGMPGEHGHAIFAADGQVVFEHLLPHAPRRQTARWSSLPHVMPLVMQLSETVPYVVVLANRVGADITAYGPNGAEPTERSVDGETFDIRKVQPGGYAGWSQRRFQRRAENVWEHNAKLVAEQVDQLVGATGARVLAVAGDVRARAALKEHLGKRSLGILTEIETGARAAGAAEEPLNRRIQQLLAEAGAAWRLAHIMRFQQARGHHDRAVEGLKSVTAALRRAQVAELLLRDDPSSTATLWVGRQATDLAVEPSELADAGVSDPVEDRADAAIVRALVCTGAGLLAVGPEMSEERLPLADGVGALLRYADAATSG
jgi:hypothetical protein